MEINADFGARAAVHSDRMDWIASPMKGVDRRMLDRLGGEVARATSIVRYAPGSRFSAHTHDGGEEFLVLEGVFQDEHGAFPAGSYIRNPPQSSHTPGSEPGCVIFVKLWQFDPADRTHVRIATDRSRYVPEAGRAGIAVMPLYEDARESVALERWEPGTKAMLDAPDGLELLVLDGTLEEGGERFGKGGWLRLPRGYRGQAVAGGAGSRLWLKRGHLAEDPLPPRG